MPEPDVLLESSDPPPPPTAVRRSRTSPTTWSVLVTLALVVVAGAAWAAGPAGGSATVDRLVLAVVLSMLVSGYVACRPRPHETLSESAFWGRVPRLLGWLLVVGWALACVGVVLVGERQASVDRLRGAIDGGSVDTVRAVGALQGRGQARVELHWTQHGIRYTTQVQQVRGSIRGLDGLGGEVSGRIRGDLGTALGQYGEVRVVNVARTYPRIEADLLGWRVTGWALVPIAALGLLTLQVLAVSPEPWRATRWAWFWIMLFSLPLGPLAFLLLGGPTGATRQPRPGSRRLTGGWTFLLCLLFGGAWR